MNTRNGKAFKSGRRPTAAAALLYLMIGGCGPPAQPPPVLYEAPDFALVDQDGDTLRAEALRGRAWVASFVFTNCEDVCSLITVRKAALRDSLEAARLLGSEVRLVSFTVDPARDTPDVLREYATTFGGSPPDRWAFLTGSPPERVRELVQEGFLVAALLPPDADEPERLARQEAGRHVEPGRAGARDHVHPPAGTDGDGGAHGHDPADGVGDANYQVTHSPRLLLVDRKGRVRGTYVATEPEAIDDLLADIRAVLRGG